MTSELILKGYKKGYYKKVKCSECPKYFYVVNHIRGGLRPPGLKKMTDKTCSRVCSRKRTAGWFKKQCKKKK